MDPGIAERVSLKAVQFVNPPPRAADRGVGMTTTVLHNPAQRARATVALPEGITVGEAQFLLEVVSRLKAKRFGRFVVMVSDGRVVDVEIVEKIDRNLLKKL